MYSNFGEKCPVDLALILSQLMGVLVKEHLLSLHHRTRNTKLLSVGAYFSKKLTTQLIVPLEKLLRLYWVFALKRQKIRLCLKTEDVKQDLRPGVYGPVQVPLVVETVVFFWVFRWKHSEFRHRLQNRLEVQFSLT